MGKLKIGRQPDKKDIEVPCITCKTIMLCSKQQSNVKKYCSESCQRKTKVLKDLYPKKVCSFIYTLVKCKQCKEDIKCNQWQKTKQYCSEKCQRASIKKVMHS